MTLLCHSEGYVGEGDIVNRESWPQANPIPQSAFIYRNNFFPYPHTNLFFKEASTVFSIRLQESGNYTGILRTPQGTEMIEISAHDIKKRSKGVWKLFKKKKNSIEEVASMMKPEISPKSWSVCNSELVKHKLLDLETPDIFGGKYRIGLVYSQAHQTDEKQFFSNVQTSPEFEEFLDLMGDRIELLGWEKHHGGLDVTNGTTGKYSLYTEWEGEEIMWHIPTFMPYYDADPQQLERKKFVGNDRAVVLFRDEGAEPIAADTISSNAIHLFCVIQPFHKPDDDQVYYKVAISTKSTVPSFDPPLPETSVFEKGPQFREFFIQKLLNGIKATAYADEFKALMGFKYMHSLSGLFTEESRT